MQHFVIHCLTISRATCSINLYNKHERVEWTVVMHKQELVYVRYFRKVSWVFVLHLEDRVFITCSNRHNGGAEPHISRGLSNHFLMFYSFYIVRTYRLLHYFTVCLSIIWTMTKFLFQLFDDVSWHIIWLNSYSSSFCPSYEAQMCFTLVISTATCFWCTEEKIYT